MLKVFGKPAICFAEFPTEIALCLNISNCPGHCEHCSEPELLADIGDTVTEELLDKYISENPGISMIGFMGGDNDHDEICKLSSYIHSKNLKVGMYSGQDYLDINLLNCLDYYKIGRFIMPQGNQNEWWKKNCGPINFTFSNQVMFKKVDSKWYNITSEFRKIPINNLEKYIIK